LLEWYREFALAKPEELYGFFALLKVPPGPPFPQELHFKTMCGIVWSYCSPLDKAEEVFRPVRQFRAPKFEITGPMPFYGASEHVRRRLPTGFAVVLERRF
jgi:hypothetical protein